MSAIFAQSDRHGADTVHRALALMKATRERTQARDLDQIKPLPISNRNNNPSNLPKWRQMLDTALHWVQQFDLGQDDPAVAFPDGFFEEARKTRADANKIANVVANTIKSSGEPALLAAFYILEDAGLLTWTHAIGAMENVSLGKTTNLFVDSWAVLLRRCLAVLESEEMEEENHEKSNLTSHGFAGQLCKSIVINGIWRASSSKHQEQSNSISLTNTNQSISSSAMTTHVLMSTLTRLLTRKYDDPGNNSLTALLLAHVAETLAADDVSVNMRLTAQEETNAISRNSIIQTLIDTTFTLSDTATPLGSRLVDTSLNALAYVVTAQDMSAAVGRFAAQAADPFRKDGLGAFARLVRVVCKGTRGIRSNSNNNNNSSNNNNNSQCIASSVSEHTQAISAVCETMVLNITQTYMEQQRGKNLRAATLNQTGTSAEVAAAEELDTARYLGCAFILMQHALLKSMDGRGGGSATGRNKTDELYQKWLAKAFFGAVGSEVATVSGYNSVLRTTPVSNASIAGSNGINSETAGAAGAITCSRSCTFILNVLMALAPHESIFASKAQRRVLASALCPLDLKQTDTMQVYFSIVASRERDFVAANKGSAVGIVSTNSRTSWQGNQSNSTESDMIYTQQRGWNQQQPEIPQNDRESHAMLKGFLNDWRSTRRVPHGAMAHFKLLNPRMFTGQFTPLLLSLEIIAGIDELPSDARRKAMREEQQGNGSRKKRKGKQQSPTPAASSSSSKQANEPDIDKYKSRTSHDNDFSTHKHNKKKKRKTNAGSEDDAVVVICNEEDEGEEEGDNEQPGFGMLTLERSELVDAVVQYRGAPLIPRGMYEMYAINRQVLLAREKADAAVARNARRNAAAAVTVAAKPSVGQSGNGSNKEMSKSAAERLFNLAHVELPQLAARLVTEPIVAEISVNLFGENDNPNGDDCLPHSRVQEWKNSVEKLHALANAISPELQTSHRSRGGASENSIVWWSNVVTMAWVTCGAAIVKTVDIQIMNGMMNSCDPQHNISACRKYTWQLIGQLAAKLFSWCSENYVIIGQVDAARGQDMLLMQSMLNDAFVRLLSARVLDGSNDATADMSELRALGALVSHIPDKSIVDQLVEQVCSGVWSRGARSQVHVLIFLSMLVDVVGTAETGNGSIQGNDMPGTPRSVYANKMASVLALLQVRFRFALEYGCVADVNLVRQIEGALSRSNDVLLNMKSDKFGVHSSVTKICLPTFPVWLRWERECAQSATVLALKESAGAKRRDVLTGSLRLNSISLTYSSHDHDDDDDEQDLFGSDIHNDFQTLETCTQKLLFVSSHTHGEWMVHMFNTYYANTINSSDAAKNILVELCLEVCNTGESAQIPPKPHMSRWRTVDVPPLAPAGLMVLLRHCTSPSCTFPSSTSPSSTSTKSLVWVLGALHEVFKQRGSGSAMLGGHVARNRILDDVVRVVLCAVEAVTCVPGVTIAPTCDIQSCNEVVFGVLASPELRPWPASVLELCKCLVGGCVHAQELVNEEERVASGRADCWISSHS